MQISDPTKSNIPRCRHSVYAPHGTPNTLCSCCHPVDIPRGHRFVYARDDNGTFKKIEDLD
jgi:hypothetical protein